MSNLEPGGQGSLEASSYIGFDMSIAALLAVVAAFGFQSEADAETAQKELLIPFYAREAAAYEFSLESDPNQKALIQQEPVLTWTNVDHYMGAVFVWTCEGRPEVIGCIGSQQLPSGECVVFHELHSLSLGPMAPIRFGEGQQTWNPSRPGIEMAAFDGAPAPSDSERLRLTQMRNLAREFKGSMKDGKDITELRLLTQPLVRYKAPERGVVDGAIFALVWKGTDPEVLLVLEDRKDQGEERWHYGFARFNFRDLWVNRGDREVWRVAGSGDDETYITKVVKRTSLDAIRESAPAPESVKAEAATAN